MDKHMNAEENIPEQRDGRQLDVEQAIELSTDRLAHSTFVEATRRLLHVNLWGEISGQLSASFQLFNEGGVELSRVANEGDFIRINLPAPGNAAGEGFDWVRIERIEDKPSPGTDYESCSMTVRPAPSPTNSDPDVAHFYSDKATSTFMVERSSRSVKVSVHGRNEEPNRDVEGVGTRVRNTVVATVATTGVAAVQWNSLVSGILKDL